MAEGEVGSSLDIEEVDFEHGEVSIYEECLVPLKPPVLFFRAPLPIRQSQLRS